MEESEDKICPNCKREIPSVNFTIHTVHCARNIKVCPVCKEPVPHSELQEHHEKLHKLMPCKQCGESVCGTDLEDHIRDSCGHTIKSCRYCELELPRHEIPAHEGYCGVRTEQCPDCKEWVMIKYRQLHLDSNHGFLRLDDDPAPQPKKLLSKTNINPIRDMLASTSNGVRPANGLRGDADAARTETRVANITANTIGGGDRNVGRPLIHNEVRNAPATNGFDTGRGSGDSRKPLVKRGNDQPQVNTTVTNVNKLHKEGTSRGAIKKRPAPKPPANRQRDLQYYSAVQRQQAEDRQRRQQNEINASLGLPPVLSPAAKLDKLRKMDVLHNRETERQDYKNKLQGRVWMNADTSTAGHRLEVARETVRNDLSNLEPMTPSEFMSRFEQLQLGDDSGDRFSQIKTSLRELRRGLNEVTAPYNSTANNQSSRPRPRSSPEPAVLLPCEFCGAPVLPHDLVQHQTGCRPDLTQYRPRRESPVNAAPVPVPDPYEQPVIPCEFCTESLPVYLITEHQERCRREPNLLFPD